MKIFHRCSARRGHCLKTFYGTLLGPGAEAVLADLTTSFTSFRVGTLVLNRVHGCGGYMRAAQWPRSFSFSHAVAVGVFDVAVDVLLGA